MTCRNNRRYSKQQVLELINLGVLRLIKLTVCTDYMGVKVSSQVFNYFVGLLEVLILAVLLCLHNLPVRLQNEGGVYRESVVD